MPRVIAVGVGRAGDEVGGPHERRGRVVVGAADGREELGEVRLGAERRDQLAHVFGHLVAGREHVERRLPAAPSRLCSTSAAPRRRRWRDAAPRAPRQEALVDERGRRRRAAPRTADAGRRPRPRASPSRPRRPGRARRRRRTRRACAPRCVVERVHHDESRRRPRRLGAEALAVRLDLRRTIHTPSPRARETGCSTRGANAPVTRRPAASCAAPRTRARRRARC